MPPPHPTPGRKSHSNCLNVGDEKDEHSPFAAGIEAPIRFCLTEGADGTATLSYRMLTTVFAPYLDGASADLSKVATEFDAIFDKIANEVTRP